MSAVVAPSRKRSRNSVDCVASAAQDASCLRAALSARAAIDATPDFWRAATEATGTSGADPFLCHLGRSAAAAIHALDASAESARATLREKRATLHAVIDARFDALEAALDVERAKKANALELELETIDAALERWRRETKAARDAAETLDDEHLVEQQSELSKRLDEATALLWALPTGVVEPPLVRFVADVPRLVDTISRFGDIAAPLPIHACDLTFKRIPPYALGGSALRFCLALGDTHSAQSEAELEVSLGRLAAGLLDVSISLVGPDGASQVLPARLECRPANRFIYVAVDLPETPLRGSAISSRFSVVGHEIGATVHVPVVRGLSAEGRASLESDDPNSVVAAILRNMGSADKIARGCKALARILKSRSSRRPGWQSAVDAGAAVALVAALQAHAGSARVSRKASAALSCLASEDEGAVVAVDAGAPSALVAALSSHTASADVVAAVCSAIAAIAFPPQCEAAFVEVGALPAIISVLRSHLDDAHAVYASCWALASTTHCSSGKRAAAAAGAVRVLLRVMRSPATSRVAVIYASTAFDYMMDLKRVRHSAIECGAPALLVAALHRHNFDEDISSNVCSIMSCITTLPAGLQAAVVGGAPAALVRAMELHAEKAQTVADACATLANMTATPAGQHALVDAKAPTALILAMRKHSSNPHVLKAVRKAMAKMTGAVK